MRLSLLLLPVQLASSLWAPFPTLRRGTPSDLKMAATQIPRGQAVTFDFKVVAGGKGAEWGEVVEVFPQRPGTLLFTSVVSFPLGCVVEEVDGGDALAFSEVAEGLGGAAAGIRPGDRLRAVTALVVPRAANLVKEPVGALFTANPLNPRLFDQAMEALQSNSPANGGTGKAIIVFERDVRQE